jgi:hypothetical protein
MSYSGLETWDLELGTRVNDAKYDIECLMVFYVIWELSHDTSYEEVNK